MIVTERETEIFIRRSLIGTSLVIKVANTGIVTIEKGGRIVRRIHLGEIIMVRDGSLGFPDCYPDFTINDCRDLLEYAEDAFQDGKVCEHPGYPICPCTEPPSWN